MDRSPQSPDEKQVDVASRRPDTLRPLMLLNLALLIVLGTVTFSASSDAQPRGRGDYTMVAGDVRGTSAGAVYVVDVRNQEMMVIAYDVSEQRLDGIAYRNLRRDLEAMRGDVAPRR